MRIKRGTHAPNRSRKPSPLRRGAQASVRELAKRLQHRVALERLHDRALDAAALRRSFIAGLLSVMSMMTSTVLFASSPRIFLTIVRPAISGVSTSLSSELHALPCIARVDAETVPVQKENRPLCRAQYWTHPRSHLWSDLLELLTFTHAVG